jgi:hypothetical protein
LIRKRHAHKNLWKEQRRVVDCCYRRHRHHSNWPIAVTEAVSMARAVAVSFRKAQAASKRATSKYSPRSNKRDGGNGSGEKGHRRLIVATVRDERHEYTRRILRLY